MIFLVLFEELVDVAAVAFDDLESLTDRHELLLSLLFTLLELHHGAAVLLLDGLGKRCGVVLREIEHSLVEPSQPQRKLGTMLVDQSGRLCIRVDKFAVELCRLLSDQRLHPDVELLDLGGESALHLDAQLAR